MVYIYKKLKKNENKKLIKLMKNKKNIQNHKPKNVFFTFLSMRDWNLFLNGSNNNQITSNSQRL